jgi:phosphate starvation-inducible membrane PsiE
MKKKEKNSSEDFREIIKDRKIVSLVFLGIGLALFLINISSFLAYTPMIVNYDELAFNISVFSSILIIVYAVYILQEGK